MRKYARYVPFTFAEQQKAMRAKTIMVWILILEIRNWHDHTLKAISFHKNNHKCFGNRNLEAILGLKLIHNRVIFSFTLSMLLACHKKSYLICDEVTNFSCLRPVLAFSGLYFEKKSRYRLCEYSKICNFVTSNNFSYDMPAT